MMALGRGNLRARIDDGYLRAVMYRGTEVLRGLSYPVRDRDWGTCLVRTLSETVSDDAYRRAFAEAGGAFDGTFTAMLEGDRLEAVLEIRFARAMEVNRAGFTLLHPIAGVAGQALVVTHPDGTEDETRFPRFVSPGQPARDIVALRHSVGGVLVTVTMEGEVFEMEDQRNWSDASFKTYCRPLSLPRPYPVQPGETVRQRVTLVADGAAAAMNPAPRPAGTVTLPQVMLAHEPPLSTDRGLAGFPALPVLLRLSADMPDGAFAALRGRPLALEIVFDDAADLDRQIARCRAAALLPMRVMALPAAYLKSHQPEGPWPEGAAPQDALGPLRAAFPEALVGGGSLTNFTELNRCPPDAAQVDFLSFGNTAIVHAADDLSVCQTLEALPDLFASAARLAAGKPLHLGLVSIGMRSNPYGAAVAPNPGRLRLAMAMDDPRQETGFAAFYAASVLAAAAEAGVRSLALAMPDGPLGAQGRPLGAVLHQAAALAGQAARITRTGGLLRIETAAGGIAANGGPETETTGAGAVPPFGAITWEASA